jgi:serine/alanine adding enzyme
MKFCNWMKPPMPDLPVRILDPSESANWDQSLLGVGGFTALDAWSFFLRENYGYQIYRLEILENGKIAGFLVLTHVRHIIFGNYLATSPFGSYGGFAYTSIEVRDALLRDAHNLADALGVEYVVIRFIDDSKIIPVPWLQLPLYSTYLIDLPDNAENLWEGFGPQHRKHTRQSIRRGFQVQFGHLEHLDDTFEILSQSMHELGSPYHSKKYLERMAISLGDRLEFVIVRDARGLLAGSAVLIYQDRTATSLHANILRDFRSDYAGEFLYWSILEHCCQKGMTVCDLGRSLNGSGNEAFKLKWRSRKIPLAYWYYLPKGGPIPELNQKSAKFQLAIRIWRLLPAFIVRALGPGLIRGII